MTRFESEQEIEAAERAVWNALVSGDAAADAALLSDDFLGVYPSGFSGRDGHAAQLSAGPSMAGYAMSEIRYRHLAPDLVLIAYRADYTSMGADRPAAMLISSIWRRKGAGWVNVFSQDTPID